MPTIVDMKVLRKNPNKKFRTLTLRIEESVMSEVDKVAGEAELSRQALITAILKQVLNDPKFVLKVED